jgi:formate dehydrogenase (hydrogenase)
LLKSRSATEEETMNNTTKARLTTPLIRENGKHRAASWDEALDKVAAGFRAEIEKHGPRTFGMFSCSKTTNELNYTAQKFVRSVIGTNNIDSCNRT